MNQGGQGVETCGKTGVGPLVSSEEETWTFAHHLPDHFDLEVVLFRPAPAAYHGGLTPRPGSLRTR